jgi:cytochrome c oxidase subunit II
VIASRARDARALPRAMGRLALLGAALTMALAGSALAAAEVSPEVAAEGERVYGAQCAVCHLPTGEGAPPTFPSLVDNELLVGDPREPIHIVLFGRGAMPSFGDTLSDEEIAAVLTHERTSWGNDADPISEEQVAEVRAEEDAEAAPDAEEPGVDAEAEPIDVDLPEEWFELGRAAYAEACSACHQPDGAGIPGAFPALAGNPFVTGPAQGIVHVVLNGRAGMPSFGGLSDERIALIVSYVRNAWENDAHPVDAEMVATVRDGDELDLERVSPLDRPGAGQ